MNSAIRGRTIARRAAVVLAVAFAAFGALAADGSMKQEIESDIQAGHWTQADDALTEVLQKHPNNAVAHYWMAQVRLNEGKLDDARSQLAQAKQLDPSLKFASDPAKLADMEESLNAPTPQHLSSRREGYRPYPGGAARPMGHRHHAGLFLIVLVALGAFAYFSLRKRERSDLGNERARVRGLLEEAYNDLRDANRAIDTHPEYSPEQRLAMSDRVSRAQADVSTHLASLGTRTDFRQSYELVRRVRDIAAEIRGEERPSETEARRAAEAQRMQPGYGGGYGQPMPGTGGHGLGTAGAALGGLAAGVALGSLMGHGERAEARERDDGYIPDDNGGPRDIDLGGSGDAGNDWDAGGGGNDTFDASSSDADGGWD